MENISKYLENPKFIQWIFNPDEKTESWWETFGNENPKEKQNIQLARNILSKFKTSDKELSPDEKILLFSKILRQVEEKPQTLKTKRLFVGLLKYAAVAILFFSIGALVFYHQHNFNPQFYSQNLDEPLPGNEAKLIRPNGENILLKEQKSLIEYTQDGQVAINNDTLKTVKTEGKGTPEFNQLIIPYGKTSVILLPDGTRVHLNAGSRFVYPEYFADNNREVFLAGEAFFEVSHDKNHPFIVQTTDLRIKVLGTKFNISAYPSDNVTETVLTEGKVRLEQNNSGFFDSAIDILPGQLASFDRTSRKTNLIQVETENYILWKEGMFKFESTDLSRIAKKLERFYNIRFLYSDAILGTIKISGKLKLDENREEIISRIATAASVSIDKKGESFYEIKR